MNQSHIYQLKQSAQTDYFKQQLPTFIYIDETSTIYSYPDLVEFTYYAKYRIHAHLLDYQPLCHIDNAYLHPEYFL